jgi:hypothetical protein
MRDRSDCALAEIGEIQEKNNTKMQIEALIFSILDQ